MSDPPRWLIGQRVAWLGSGSGLPRTATARWIGRLPGMGAGWTVGIELDEALPLGGVDGKWAGRRLFNCKRSHGLFVPLASIIPESDLRTRVKQGFGETPWLKELEEEFREVRQETLKRIKDKDERKLKNDAGKEAGRNGIEKEKELVTPTDIPKEETLIEAQKEKRPLPPVNDEDEVNGVYQWYDAIDHTGESQGPVVEHLYEEVGGKPLGRDEIVKHPQTVPRKGRRREFRRIGTSDGRGGAAMTGVGAGGPMGQVERESGRVGGLSSVEEGEGSYGTNSTQRRSGFFSFLRWFKKGKEEHTECNRDCEKEEVEKEEEFDEVLDLPASPRLPSKFGTWSSVDTLASTSSFAFVQPTDYLSKRVNHVELGIEPGPDTDTYRHRLKIRERSRHLDQDLTLRRKYRLHDFEVEPTPEQRRKILRLPGDVIEDEEEEGEDVGVSTLGKRSNSTSRKGTVSSHTSSFGRKKRRAPLPPGFDLSLPNTLEHPNKSGEKTGSGSQNSRHRRSASESRTRSGYCHVKGKRRAPPPPKSHSPAFSPTVALPEPSQGPKTQSVSVNCTPPTSPRYGSFGKRKRAAPPPPVNISVREDKEVQAADGLMSGRGEGSHLSPEERRRLIANIAMLRAHAEKGKISMGNTRGMVSPPGSPRTGEGQTHFVRHDYLRIEKGQLLTTVEKVSEGVMGNSSSEQKATLSPRPWYKRKSVLRDSPSSSKKEALHSPTPSFFKSLEKRKPWKKKEGDEVGGLGDDEDDDDWMPEVGYRRPGGIFGGASSSEVTVKHEEEEVSGEEQVKRRSQVISMLANISELDREAAAIVNEERKKEREAASAEDEKFYAEPELPPVLAAAWSGGVAVPPAPITNTSSNEENQSMQPKGNAKHLISLFNSISGVSNASSSNENKVTSFVSVIKEDAIEEQVTEEEAERKRSTAETVQALVLDANRARLNGRKNLGRGNSNGSDKIQIVAGNSVNGEVKNSESKSEEASGPAKEDPPQVWVCARCTLENPKWRLTCDACNMWRPSGGWQGRRGSGDSEVKNKVENLEKDNASKGNNKSSGSNINWETELKKYFPNQDPKTGESKTVAASKPNDTKEIDLPNKSSVSSVGLKDDKSQEKAIVSSSNVPAVQKKIVVPNFIGGVGGKQRVEVSGDKLKNEKTEIRTEGKDDKDIKADVYEVRKARLAFFSMDRSESQEKTSNKEAELGEFTSSEKFGNKTDKKETHESKVFEKNTSSTTAKSSQDGSLEAKKKVNQKPASVSVDTLSKSKQNIDGEEKQKLRDMLKEMKNSLPHAHRSKGAIKKVLTDARAIVEEVPPPPPQRSDSAVEAYLVTTETVYENIKIRPQPLPPGTKVSSSAQTSSAIVRKVTPSKDLLLNSSSIEKAPFPSPPSAPSLSTINKGEALIRDGILYTSLKRKVIGAGTFELIHAGDFASIEATKTGGSGGPVHLYANLPPPGRVRASGAVRLAQRSSEGIPPAGPFPSRQQEISSKNADQERAAAVKAETPLPPASSPSLPDNSKEVDEAKAEEDRLTAQLTLPKGLAKFKASLVPEEEGNLTDLEASGRLNPDTLAVARLLRRLEAAIAGGQHESAAVLARQLARLKINCSVTRHANNRRNLMGSPRESSVEGGPSSAASSTSGSAKITIDMYVEDKVSHLGPIPVVVSTSMTVGELKIRVEQDFEIPVNVQRWIIGRRLASDDSLTLLQHDVTSNGTPVFLYLVAPGDSEANASVNASAKDSKSSKASEKGEESDASEQKKTEEENAPIVPEERMIAKPMDEMPRGRGWYYNFEEDRYSYCSESDSEPEEVEQPQETAEVERPKVIPERQSGASGEPRRNVIIQNGVRLIVQEDEDEDDDFIDEVEEEEYVEEAVEEVEEEEYEEEVLEEVEEEVEEEEEEEVEEEEEEEEDDEEVAGAVGGALHVSPQQAVVSAKLPDPPPENKTGTLQLGWKCPLCTLVNPPTRPGCAACASERPANYRLPSNYKAGREEAERLNKEEKNQMAQEEAKKNEEDEKKRDYERLLHLEKSELVPNAEEFTCPVCFVDFAPNEGVTLRDCLHTFCRPCLVNTIQFSEEAEVKCPYRDDNYACDSTLQDREIRALVPAGVYEQLLARSMALAEKRMGAQAFHCKTPDCKGWCVLEDNINVFPCPVCRHTNCLTCQAIHDGLNCKQYQEGLNKDSETNADAKRTRDMLEEMVTRGEAIVCPTCKVVLMKKWGCDWLRCSMCKTEICWVTRGPRWGPGGKGDVTGGCKCGVNGVKCHPKCNYCH